MASIVYYFVLVQQHNAQQAESLKPEEEKQFIERQLEQGPEPRMLALDTAATKPVLGACHDPGTLLKRRFAWLPLTHPPHCFALCFGHPPYNGDKPFQGKPKPQVRRKSFPEMSEKEANRRVFSGARKDQVLHSTACRSRINALCVCTITRRIYDFP